MQGEMEQLISYGRPMITVPEFKEQVRVNLMRYLENYRHRDVTWIARQSGYSMWAIQHFKDGSRVTLPIAMTLIQKIPELGDQLICPTCQGVPALHWS